MLRNLLVLVLAGVGVAYALQGPFQALVFYLWYAYFRPDLWAWTDFFERINLSLLLGVYVAAATLISRHRLRFDLHLAVIALFGLHALAAAQVSTHVDLAMVAWLKLAKRLIATYLIAVLITDRTKLRIVLLVIGLSLAFEGAKQGWLGMILRPGLMNANPWPVLGDNNAVAVGMLMLVPILATLAKTEPRGWLRWGLVFLLVGVAYRALSTYSRGGFVAAGALAVYFWLRSKRRTVTLAVLLAASLLVSAAMPDTFWERMRTTVTYEETEDRSAAGRFHFWRVAKEMANERPLVGVGPGVYRVVYDHYDPSFGAYGSSRVVHSTWFGVLAEHGYVGLLLYLAMFALAFRNTSRVAGLVRRGEAEPELAAYGVMLEAGLLVFTVGAAFLSLPEMEIPYHFVGLSVALLALARRGAIGTERADGAGAAAPVSGESRA